MLNELKQRESENRPIHIGLVGLGAMGLGIAWQIGKTPGMRLAFCADLNLAAAEKGRDVYGRDCLVTTDALAALQDEKVQVDVLVEATNSVVAAYDYCMAAIERKAHVVLMNAEVDLLCGPLMQDAAAKQGVVVTSDGGDQHGVLARMMEEVEMWGFQIMQAGNMKGFLKRDATIESLRVEAEKRRLSAVQCCAYTDGSKLNIEMALIANEYGLTPTIPGMEGPKAQRVEDVLDLFDFDSYDSQGRIDYTLGVPNPGGGVYVVGRCDSEFQAPYLDYYKVNSKKPYYLFYRPYHLCHLETPRAAALAALYGKAVLTGKAGRVCDAYAYAKQDLPAGTAVQHAIGSDQVYGLVEVAAEANRDNRIPQGVLEAEGNEPRPTFKRAVKANQPLTWDDFDLPDTRMLQLWEKQKPLMA